jgi:tRNA(His) 5'-end guanylyltransferase
MDPKELEAGMREREMFSALRLLPGAWTVIRLDGRAFTKFTAGRFAKPFDLAFCDAMVQAASALFEDLGGVYASTHSDEISVAFVPEWERFGRRLEKIVSVAAGLASAAFTRAVGEPAHFDARIWQGASVRDAIAYFRWRQDDCARCALHAWCYWTLYKAGMDSDSARRELEGRDRAAQRELLLEHGVNFNDLPAWQRGGVGLYWEAYEKLGYNPVTRSSVTATRRAVKRDFDLPLGDDYEAFLLGLFERGRAELAHAA